MRIRSSPGDGLYLPADAELYALTKWGIGAQFLGSGCFRRAYQLRDGTIMKVPRTEYGVVCNRNEIETHAQAPDVTAKCWGETFTCPGFGQVILCFMEPVLTEYPYPPYLIRGRLNPFRMPDWAESLDGQQAGYTENGYRFVAYDYGMCGDKRLLSGAQYEYLRACDEERARRNTLQATCQSGTLV